MFILRDLLLPLQEEFSNTKQGQERKVWFIYGLLSVVVPFTWSMTSNLLRTLQTLFGLEIQSQRFYAFMASPTLPWKALWRTMWKQIPNPTTDGRIMVALDDSINPKNGKKIFGCGHFHNHATKGSQNSYPWSQCILAIGLLKVSSVRLENCSSRKTGLRTAPIRLDCKFLDFELFFQLNLYHASSSQSLIQIEWQKQQKYYEISRMTLLGAVLKPSCTI